MLFKRIETEGIAHYSYLIGDGGEAAVIDPRIDCGIYVEEAHPQGYRLTRILETHRHEDFVLGSAALAGQTGAVIWHADAQWQYRYGSPAEDGQIWKIGRLTLKALHSPGHTPGSMSYLLSDRTAFPGWSSPAIHSSQATWGGSTSWASIRPRRWPAIFTIPCFKNCCPWGMG